MFYPYSRLYKRVLDELINIELVWSSFGSSGANIFHPTTGLDIYENLIRAAKINISVLETNNLFTEASQ